MLSVAGCHHIRQLKTRKFSKEKWEHFWTQNFIERKRNDENIFYWISLQHFMVSLTWQTKYYSKKARGIANSLFKFIIFQLHGL